MDDALDDNRFAIFMYCIRFPLDLKYGHNNSKNSNYNRKNVRKKNSKNIMFVKKIAITIISVTILKKHHFSSKIPTSIQTYVTKLALTLVELNGSELLSYSKRSYKNLPFALCFLCPETTLLKEKVE